MVIHAHERTRIVAAAELSKSLYSNRALVQEAPIADGLYCCF